MKEKIKLLLVFAALLVLPFACEDILSTEEKAEKASGEFCECLQNNSRSKCEDELNRNYGAYADNDDFYSTFNKVNDCNITISKKSK